MIAPKAELETSPCLLCGSVAFASVCAKGQFGLPAHVVVCRPCGFSFLNPRWNKERYDRFYREEYDRYYRPDVFGEGAEERRAAPARTIIARLRERDMLRAYRRVLDIGSGRGEALIQLRALQQGEGDFEAIEPSPACCEHLERAGIPLLSSDVDAPWERGREGRYDLVVMRHVLEHFHDPLSVLRKAREVLAADGTLYVAVPDAAHPPKRLRSYFFRVVHLSYFTRASLAAMLQRAGFEVVHCVEGDQRGQHEVFVLCRPGSPRTLPLDPGAFDRQMAVYRRAARLDPLYDLKDLLARGVNLARTARNAVRSTLRWAAR